MSIHVTCLISLSFSHVFDSGSLSPVTSSNTTLKPLKTEGVSPHTTFSMSKNLKISWCQAKTRETTPSKSDSLPSKHIPRTFIRFFKTYVSESLKVLYEPCNGIAHDLSGTTAIHTHIYSKITYQHMAKLKWSAHGFMSHVGLVEKLFVNTTIFSVGYWLSTMLLFFKCSNFSIANQTSKILNWAFFGVAVD